MSVAREIEARLQAGDCRGVTAGKTHIELEIIDQSDQHRGHAGWREGGETHFHMRVVSHAFTDLSRIERQRAVHEALGDMLEATVHALSMDLRAPGEG